jgi:hypothetical protein
MNKKILQDKTQALFPEDDPYIKKRFKEGLRTNLLPNIGPHPQSSIIAHRSILARNSQ